jgi:mono/diheme cytochrome c family protein
MPHTILRLLAVLTMTAGVLSQDPLAAIKEGSPSLQLYALHCSPCHGERGRGDGPGARFLDPAPRDLTSGSFRLVSTENRVPSDVDLFEIIAQGLPGTAMLPFAHLGDDKVWELVRVVRAFHHQQLEALYRPDAVDAEELRAWVTQDTTPGPAIQPTDEPPDTVDSRARGRLHFHGLCASCHGPEGRGGLVPTAAVFESDRDPDPDNAPPVAPARSRDLTLGVLKGGTRNLDLFRRIRCGMPGSPMPSVTKESLSDEQVWDLIHFLRTLIPAGAHDLHVAQGQRIWVPRIEGGLPTAPTDARFDAAQDFHLAFAPFRNDEFTLRGVAVRALHDGKHVIFRFQWVDATRDVPSPSHRFPPDGIAVRITNMKHPPVLPVPGLPLPLDRAIWLAGDMPDEKDPLFDGVEPRFENPGRVCVSPIGPEHVGAGSWRDRIWTVSMAVSPDRAGEVTSGGTMAASFAAFDGSLRRGPMPVAFTPWQTLVFE